MQNKILNSQCAQKCLAKKVEYKKEAYNITDVTFNSKTGQPIFTLTNDTNELKTERFDGKGNMLFKVIV